MDVDQALGFPLTRLPLDVIEPILCRVESRRDLVSFAATSIACKTLVIPRHTEYRTLRVRDRPEVWAHLAQRPDLSRNIREVIIRGTSPMKSCSQPERYPVTWVDAASQSDPPETIIANMCEALRNMDNLRSFTWICAWNPSGLYVHLPHYHASVFQVLKDSKSLVRFKMVDKMALGTLSTGPVAEEEYPLWHIANLQSLFIRPLEWWPKGMNSLLLRSPNLQALDIRLPNDGSSVFTSCSFPQLRRLNLNSTGSSSEREVIQFLQNHPTIQDLRWYPHNDELQLGHGSLPNLKTLITSPEIACSVLADPTVPNRVIECVSQLSITDATLAILDAIDTSRLRDLRVWRYSGLETINRLAELFPNLTRLEVPKFGIPTRDDTENENYTIDDYILTLSKFRCLEYLLDSAIWPMLLLDSEKITSLAIRCPNLQRLGHYNSGKSQYVDIVFRREGREVLWTEETAEKEWHS
ncbi:F-box domain-containing protein [Mycena sanguinolenta]|uniref:F-box domain-containing protein n=1 Tax=Mycena sanguinolenta TaxID=230812 RepID=A0A8H7D2N9_9AGAR|nr:F-box domain-containing protein [Mycena sanguinolenta]